MEITKVRRPTENIMQIYIDGGFGIEPMEFSINFRDRKVTCKDGDRSWEELEEK